MKYGILFLLILAGCDKEPEYPAQPDAQDCVSLNMLAQYNKGKLPASFSIKHLMQLLARGRAREASLYVNQALLAAPRNACLHLVNGLVYENMCRNGDSSRKELIRIAYENAKSIDPSVWMASYLLGMYYMEQGAYEKAQHHLADAAMQKNDDPQVMYALAYVSYYLKDMPVAITSITKALECEGNNPVFLRAGCMIFSAVNEKAKADNCLKKYEAIIGKKNGDILSVSRRMDELRDNFVQANIHKVKGELAEYTQNDRDVEGFSDSRSNSFRYDSFDLFNKKTSEKEELPEAKVPVVLDFYFLRFGQTNTTQKGNNILDLLTITLSSNSIAPPSSATTVNERSVLGIFDNAGTNIVKKLNFTLSASLLNYSLMIMNSGEQIVEVIGRPTMSVTPGQTALFLQGEQYVGATGSAGGGAGGINSVDAGTSVEANVQSISPDGTLTIEVRTVGSIFAERPNSAKSIADQIIKITRSKISTTVKVKFGQTVLLGGMFGKVQTSSRSGVPFLQDIPVLQYFFSQQVTSSDIRSICYLITPRKGGMPATYDPFRESYCESVDKKMKKRGFGEIGRYSNFYYIMKKIENSPFFLKFRSGDLPKPFWGYNTESTEEKVKKFTSFLSF